MNEDMRGALTPRTIGELGAKFHADGHNRLMQNALTTTSLTDLARNHHVLTAIDHSFSHVLDDWSVTNQKSSGRCWMFAGLNLLRVGAMRKMDLADFEFSQNHTMFWDKLERANYFLEAMIDTRESDVDDRTVAHLLSDPIGDGGQWNMFVNLVRKHGLVPKTSMPETQSSSATAVMNRMLTTKLREGAKAIRDQGAGGASIKDLRVEKHRSLEVVHRVLCMHLGQLPQRFVWQWTDKEKKFHRDPECTPREFADRYVDVDINRYVCLVHDPRPENAVGRTYTVRYLGNVVDGGKVVYLNVEIDQLREIALKTILDGEPVWFGADVGHHMDRKSGVWDAELFDFTGVYASPFAFDEDKAARLMYHMSRMNHAMLFTGVDVAGGKPRRWRVENSWGEEPGRKGFFVMNDNWFDEYMFEIAAHPRYLSDDLVAALEEEPVELPPWDPMGSLA